MKTVHVCLLNNQSMAISTVLQPCQPVVGQPGQVQPNCEAPH